MPATMLFWISDTGESAAACGLALCDSNIAAWQDLQAPAPTYAAALANRLTAGHNARHAAISQGRVIYGSAQTCQLNARPVPPFLGPYYSSQSCVLPTRARQKVNLTCA